MQIRLEVLLQMLTKPFMTIPLAIHPSRVPDGLSVHNLGSDLCRVLGNVFLTGPHNSDIYVPSYDGIVPLDHLLYKGVVPVLGLLQLCLLTQNLLVELEVPE